MATATISSGGGGESVGGGGSVAMTKKRNGDGGQFGIGVLNKALSLLFIGVIAWTINTTQKHAEKISADDQRLQSLDAKVAKLEASVEKLWDRVDQGFADLRNQLKSK
jgi:cell division protein FtsB